MDRARDLVSAKGKEQARQRRRTGIVSVRHWSFPPQMWDSQNRTIDRPSGDPKASQNDSTINKLAEFCVEDCLDAAERGQGFVVEDPS